MRVSSFAIYRALRRTRADRGGATSVEYGLMAVLVAIAGIAGMQALGGSVLAIWDSVVAAVSAVPQ